jgi:hypothetical protein
MLQCCNVQWFFMENRRYPSTSSEVIIAPKPACGEYDSNLPNGVASSGAPLVGTTPAQILTVRAVPT